MSLFNRFLIFFFGILFGCLILFFSLTLRKEPLSFDYLPNSRIKKYIIQGNVLIESKALCKITCFDLDTILLDEYIAKSTVDFKKSKIRGFNPKTYYLVYTLNQNHISKKKYFEFQIEKDSISLIDVSISEGPLSSNISSSSSFFSCPHCD